ncbi:MAG: preprotein translocase subunit SecG [Eubacteriales bacterium]
MEFVFGGILLALAVAIIALVLVQQGKDKKLSGAIAGGSDTFYGKSKGANKDKVLSTITAIVAVLFVVIVVAMYLIV